VNNIALDMPRTFAVRNAGENRVRIDHGRWTIEAWGDVDHLPAAALDDE
jgi:hypothetical protein